MFGHWKVQKVKIGFREFYRACRLYGHNLVYKGGLWTTEAEARRVADNLNREESITDSVFEGADSYERLQKTEIADGIAEVFNNSNVEEEYLSIDDGHAEDEYIHLTDLEVRGI